MAIVSRQSKKDSLTFRITRKDKALIEQAATRTGSDVTSFVLGPALIRAREVVERQDFTLLTGAARRQFSLLVENPPAPSKRLLRNLSGRRHQTVR